MQEFHREEEGAVGGCSEIMNRHRVGRLQGSSRARLEFEASPLQVTLSVFRPEKLDGGLRSLAAASGAPDFGRSSLTDTLQKLVPWYGDPCPAGCTALVTSHSLVTQRVLERKTPC